jgi:hypothetical protein
MIISNIIGGLGNQMFQYAAGKSLAIKLGDAFKVDLRLFVDYKLHQGFQLDKVFYCTIDVANHNDLVNVLSWQHNLIIKKFLRKSVLKILRNNRFIVEPYHHYWNGINNLTGNLYLDGYWQNEKYFIEMEDIIRKDFIFKEPLSQNNKIIAQHIASVNAVSLHIRRGDYVTNKKNSFIGLCQIDYYKKAIEIIKHNTFKPIFFVFSDDIPWAKENLSDILNINFVDNNKKNESYNDMRLMSLCRHNIIANSSFSWWGAWLNSFNDKIIIAPKKWFINDSYKTNVVPKNWIKI